MGCIFFLCMNTQGRLMLNSKKSDMAARCPACFTINAARKSSDKKTGADDDIKCALCGSRYSVAQPEAKAA